MKPLIGITSGEIINKDEPWASHVYGQKGSYSEAIVAAGGIPVFIPFLPEAELNDLYARLDGIVFAGGNDINPTLYGEKSSPLTVDVTPERDRVETQLMQWALNDDKPLLAICRGFQLFNAVCGGTLYQDITEEMPGASNHLLSTHQKDYTFIAHTLKVAPDSQLARVTGSTQLPANTHHHQGVKKVAPDLHAVAWAEDSLVEALEHPGKKFAIGVQCHPESLFAHDSKWATLFSEFIAASRV